MIKYLSLCVVMQVSSIWSKAGFLCNKIILCNKIGVKVKKLKLVKNGEHE